MKRLLIAGLVAAAVATRAAGLGEWHLRQSPVTNLTLNAVAYGNGQFVAVGEGGTILTSPDGSNWISQISGTTQTLSGVIYGSNLFVAVGNVGTTLASSNGRDWAVHVVPPVPPSPPPDLVAITHGQGLFVAGGIYTSSDGTNWSRTEAFVMYERVSFGNGVFVGVWNIGPPGAPRLYTSTNGTNWSSRPWWPDFPMAKSITFGAGRFVAVGGDVDLRHYSMITSVSTNGSDWTAQNVIGHTTFLRYVYYCGDLFFALGYGNVFSTSVDGFGWSTGIFPSTPEKSAVAFGADTYVVVGDKGTILQSDPSAPPSVEPPRLEIISALPPRILIQGIAGERLRLEYVDDLDDSSANWHEVSEITLTSPSNSLLDTNGPTTRRFYRAVVLP